MIYEQRALALAGILQSVHLVVGAAKSGMVSQDTLDKSLSCIFVQNPISLSDVYHGTSDIKLGLSLLKELLAKFDPQAHADLVRYSLAVIALERNLSKHPDVMNRLGDMVDALSQKQAHWGESYSQDQLVAGLADCYESTISKIEPRVKIGGNRQHLQVPDNINRIRALLLSAVRSAVLWHQVGGRRWQLLLAKNKLKSALENLN